MDNIYDAAVEYSKLIGYEYKFILGYKGRNQEVSLRFYEDKFYHLCGLHKLTDLAVLNNGTSTTDIFNKILIDDPINSWIFLL